MKDLRPGLFPKRPRVAFSLFLLPCLLLFAWQKPGSAQKLDPLVEQIQKERIEVINKVKPAVAAVCFYGGKACGSGVIISPDGYCLTNFHVVQPTGAIMQCGLDDGQLYDSVLVGTDKVGDVALVKLLPKVPGKPFPYVALGDSDKVQAGDWSLAMGNPFGLATDFNPTVTYGLISAVHRYQPPEGKGFLEYTDCIQIDTSINPGNSGGPLFNMQGELIGINGRGSFQKRGRINSGVGYAISMNQIKNFLGQLKAGLETDHATLGANVITENEDGDLSRIIFDQLLSDEADVTRRGLQSGDHLIRFAGRPLTSVNQYKNVLGIYPKGWRLPLVYRRNNGPATEVLVRLMGNMDKVVEDPNKPPPNQPPRPPRPQPVDPNAAKAKQSPANKLYVARKGFANYYFNQQARDSLLKEFTTKYGDFSEFKGDWAIEGNIKLEAREGPFKITWTADKDKVDEVSYYRENRLYDSLKPISTSDIALPTRMLPNGSGGLLATLYAYRRLLVLGKNGFNPETEGRSPGVTHGGSEPFYLLPEKKTSDKSYVEYQTMCDVLHTQQAFYHGKWFFSPKDHSLIGCEFNIGETTEDPCELYFSDYKEVNGRKLPHRIECRFGDKRFAVIAITKYTLGK